MEFWRKKNTDTRVVFPIQKTDGTFITGATGLDSEFALNGAHGAGAPSFGDCTHEATEIGTTGLYYLDVSAAELNDDYGSVIQVKSSSTGAVVQVLLFRTQVDDVNTTLVEGGDATDAIQAAATASLVAHNLDHLALTATAAADMTTEVADGTILSRIIGNGDTSTFVPSTDGLHAAGVDIDAILADTGTDGVVLAADAITAAKIADDAIAAEHIKADAATKIADSLLARDIGSGTGAGTSEERTVRSALRALRNKTSIATGVLTVTKENDSTASWTAAVTTDEAADPITVVDPT